MIFREFSLLVDIFGNFYRFAHTGFHYDETTLKNRCRLPLTDAISESFCLLASFPELISNVLRSSNTVDRRFRF